MRFTSPAWSTDDHGHGKTDDAHAHGGGDTHDHGTDHDAGPAHADHGPEPTVDANHGHAGDPVAETTHVEPAHEPPAHVEPVHSEPAHAEPVHVEPAYVAPPSEAAVAPVWARTGSRRRRGNPLVGLLVTLLALFGAVTVILGVKEGSIQAGGAVVDGWISTGVAYGKGLLNRGEAQAEAVVDEASAAVGETPQPAVAATQVD